LLLVFWPCWGALRGADMNYDDNERSITHRPTQRNTFVPAAPKNEITPLPNHQIQLGVKHPAQQEVIVTTNAVDRAKGFQLAITPISLVLGVLAVLVGLIFKNEFFSFASLIIFWLVFAGVYVIGWALTALATAEAVSFYSAMRQWDVIAKEQEERWAHYRWQAGREEAPQQPQSAPSQLQRDIRLALLIGVAVGVPLALAIIILGGMFSE
jgi:hypothetical protein